MNTTESLEDFYKSKLKPLPENLMNGVGHFNVFNLQDCLKNDNKPLTYNRRDFYKISLIRGHNVYHYADKSIEINGTALIFFNPLVPYTWELANGNKDNVTGFFCIFTEAFFNEKIRGNIADLPMFIPGGNPAFVLDETQGKHVETIFIKMFEEINGDYIFKYDLIRNYITEITHFALKTQPSKALVKHTNANSRITSVFTELLERQFPIETPSQRFTMRSARDYASQLSVHVNHLNRAIKVTTGKTTTHYITERLLREAKALLKHTDWNISEIGYCLGFEEPTHFNNFFKKLTNHTPKSYRIV
ncbi:helix-turn-helix domain-containing protein [Pedobacter jejuensis]|uniref:AraC family transcriptional regulator n=1 Tax=Pedobacter jejuensis TaxID=1268550 RepID=A0A3N0BTV3_9SPHI|nr:helix-turn-helix transcriptional regulator [Pedobacter jejuensis]RNL52458.1 AraC family transcriptional regulator [Pedobacter jejuensis]